MAASAVPDAAVGLPVGDNRAVFLAGHDVDDRVPGAEVRCQVADELHVSRLTLYVGRASCPSTSDLIYSCPSASGLISHVGRAILPVREWFIFLSAAGTRRGRAPAPSYRQPRMTYPPPSRSAAADRLGRARVPILQLLEAFRFGDLLPGIHA